MLNINKQFVEEFKEASDLTCNSNFKASYILETLNKVLLERMYHDNNVMYRNLAISNGNSAQELESFKMHFTNPFLSNDVCSWIETLSIKEHIELIQYVLSKISMRYY